MNHTKKFIPAIMALMFVILWAGAIFAANPAKTQVNGKELDNIPDIMSEINGAKSTMPKYSVFSLRSQNNQEAFIGNINAFDKSGNVQRREDGIESGLIGVDAGGIHIDTAKYLTSNGAGRYILSNHRIVSNGAARNIEVQFFFAEPPKNETSAPSITRVGGVVSKQLPSTSTGNSYVMDLKGGLRVDRSETSEEYFVVSSVTNANFDSNVLNTCYAVLSFFWLKEDENGMPDLFDANLDVTIPHAIGCTPVQIAVGDFTGEGITNQVAMVTADRTGLFLTLYTIRPTSAGGIEAVRTIQKRILTYPGGGWQGDFDGMLAYPAADIAAGDFDGDGKTEIVLAYRTNTTSVPLKGYYTFEFVRGGLGVSVLKWSNGDFRHEQKIQDTEWNYSESPWIAADRTYTVLWAKPVAGDFDGDGKYEFCVFVGRLFYESSSNGTKKGILAHIYPMFWTCAKGSITPNPLSPAPWSPSSSKNYQGAAYITLFSHPNRQYARSYYKYPFFNSRISVVAGPFLGRMGKFRTKDELLFSMNGAFYTDTYSTSDYRVIIPANDMKSYTRKLALELGNNKCVTGLVADDFYGEGAEFGEASHVVVTDRWIPGAAIQAPPYHFDTIPIPWSNDSQAWPMNYNYEPSAKTSYSRSRSTTDTKDTKFEATSSLEAFGPTGITVGAGTMSTIRDGVKAAATYFIQSKEAGDAAADILDALTDKLKDTETKINTNTKTIGYTNTIEAGRVDSQLFYITKTHVWRYPIKKPVPSWLVGELEKGSEKAISGDMYLSIVVPDEPSVGSGKSAANALQGKLAVNALYQARHEEGNLFSYPTTLSAIPGYSERQFSLIPRVMPISYSENQEKHKASVQTSSGNSESKSREVTSYGLFSKVAGTVKSMSGSSSDLRPNTKSETFTKKFDSSEEVEVTYPAPSKAFDWRNVTFSSQFDMYVDEAGVMTVGFAVTDLPNTASLWGADSVYWKKPDPALVMPNKYAYLGAVKQEIGKTRQIFARTQRDASKLRGVAIYSKTLSDYSNGIIYPGMSYEIHVPIYNTSFLPSDGKKSLTVPMKLYYRKAGSNDSGTLIGEPVETTNIIGGWTKGTENNKALVKFNWDKVPELEEGAYEFYIVIDPNNLIDEIHEAWTPQTPEGNNTGYFPFGISYGEPEKVITKMSSRDFGVKYSTRSAKNTRASSFMAADDSDTDTKWTEWSDLKDDTDFAEMVDGETEFVVQISYSDIDVLNEVWCEILMDSKDENGEEYTYFFAGEMSPVLTSGDDVVFSFTISEEEIRGGENLRLVIYDGEEYIKFPLYRVGGASKSTDYDTDSKDISTDDDIDAISRDITARNIYGSGGSSCNTSGTCGIILLVLAGVLMRRR